MVDDDRMLLGPDDKAEMKNVRFRTLGFYPLIGGVESSATTLPEIIQEMLLTTASELQGRGRLNGTKEARRLFLDWPKTKGAS